MLSKKTSWTQITPIPSYVPRQLAIDILHSHGEIIELNPLVLGFEGIKAPRDAPADEFYASWYEISQRIQYVPGIGRMGSGKIKFRGCFHDMPWGLQTHTYAPANVDLRNKYQICGNQPGEPPETRELGIGAPPEGLYLREDIQVKCNVTMVSFVKKETVAASKVLVERLLKKAELLDAGVLQAMMENGKLKTINPANRASSAQHSPGQTYNMPMSPLQSPTFAPQRPHSQQGGGHLPPNPAQGSNNVVMELPGDFYHAQPSPGQPSPSHSSSGHPSPNHLHPDPRYSSASERSQNMSDPRWSQTSNEYQNSYGGSRPSSYAPSEGMRSPGMDHKGFASELPTMEETKEEHSQRHGQGEQQYPEDRKYAYNPQDYAQHNFQQTSRPPQYSSYNPQGR